MSFNTNFKKIREQSGFTQTNIADFLGVDQSFISKVENGERSMTADMISKVSSLFGVPVVAFEKDNASTPKINCAFRASELSIDDLKTIATINKIALNANFMTELLERNGNAE